MWQTLEDDQSAAMRDYATIWRAADKVVLSTTLDDVSTPRTRLERTFEPELVRGLKEQETGSGGGAPSAAEALRAGLVDEVQLLLSPVIVGGGTRALPDGVRLNLELLDERRFAGGVVFLPYRL